jgi:hypothetical protein
LITLSILFPPKLAEKSFFFPMKRFFDTLGALTKAGLAIVFALASMILGARAADEQYVGKVPRLRIIVQPEPSLQYVQSI